MANYFSASSTFKILATSLLLIYLLRCTRSCAEFKIEHAERTADFVVNVSFTVNNNSECFFKSGPVDVIVITAESWGAEPKRTHYPICQLMLQHDGSCMKPVTPCQCDLDQEQGHKKTYRMVADLRRFEKGKLVLTGLLKHGGSFSKSLRVQDIPLDMSSVSDLRHNMFIFIGSFGGFILIAVFFGLLWKKRGRRHLLPSRGQPSYQHPSTQCVFRSCPLPVPPVRFRPLPVTAPERSRQSPERDSSDYTKLDETVHSYCTLLARRTPICSSQSHLPNNDSSNSPTDSHPTTEGPMAETSFLREMEKTIRCPVAVGDNVVDVKEVDNVAEDVEGQSATDTELNDYLHPV